MDAATDSMIPLLLVNLLFAVIALGIGFVAGAWFFGSKTKTKSVEPEANDAEIALEKRLNVERSLMASSRLKDLASGVATDVGQHSQLVQAITADLNAAKGASAAAQEASVSTALTQIVNANEDLQKRLAKAEEQIKAQAEEIQTHESEARTDSLTKIANRRAFDDELGRRYCEWQRKATPFSLLILDVDHFKKFNDTHGHQAGDEVLRHVASALKSACREMDIPCRYGGEEFALILPATVAKDAVGLAERVRKGIAGLKIPFENKTLSVAASVGLAQITGEDDTVRLLKRADDALYASKDAGRNCGHLHDGNECVPITGVKAAPTSSENVAGEKVETKVLDSLANRTLFAEELRRRVAESHRTDSPVSILAVELLGYRALIQEYGNAVGYMMLDSLAQFLQASIREMDLLGKLNEGQFMVMMPECTEEDTRQTGDRITKALANCKIPMGDTELKMLVKLSAGTALTADSGATLMARVEQELAGTEKPVVLV